MSKFTKAIHHAEKVGKEILNSKNGGNFLNLAGVCVVIGGAWILIKKCQSVKIKTPIGVEIDAISKDAPTSNQEFSS